MVAEVHKIEDLTEFAMQAIRDAGAQILPTETVLFGLLRDAADPRFKELLKLIK